MTLKSAGVMAALLAMGETFGGELPEHRRTTTTYVEPTKHCLVCGTEHKHNNSFCSAKCCKAYKQQPKQEG